MTEKQRPDPITQLAINETNQWINNAKLSDLINFVFDRMVTERAAELTKTLNPTPPSDGE